MSDAENGDEHAKAYWASITEAEREGLRSACQAAIDAHRNRNPVDQARRAAADNTLKTTRERYEEAREKAWQLAKHQTEEFRLGHYEVRRGQPSLQVATEATAQRILDKLDLIADGVWALVNRTPPGTLP